MKLMTIVTYWQWMRILQFPAEVVGEAVACSESVGYIVKNPVVRASEMDDG